MSATCITGIVLPPVQRDERMTSLVVAIRREIVDGLRVVRDNPIVRGITAVEMLWQLVTGRAGRRRPHLCRRERCVSAVTPPRSFHY